MSILQSEVDMDRQIHASIAKNSGRGCSAGFSMHWWYKQAEDPRYILMLLAQCLHCCVYSAICNCTSVGEASMGMPTHAAITPQTAV